MESGVLPSAVHAVVVVVVVLLIDEGEGASQQMDSWSTPKSMAVDVDANPQMTDIMMVAVAA